MTSVDYQYHHAPIPGGGFVTGLLFHPQVPDLLYCRTDIGGIYRFLPRTQSWKCLVHSIPHTKQWATYPLSFAISHFHKDHLYFVAGDGRQNSYLCISIDRGETFYHHPLPMEVYGNASGRATGERLIASRHNPDTLYFASQSAGLWITEDLGQHWRHLPVMPESGMEEINLAFIFVHPDNENLLIVSTNGQGNMRSEHVRGDSLYLSTDGGCHFSRMPGQPEPLLHPACTYPGYVAQRYAFDGKYFYVTFAATGLAWAGLSSYACDTGSCVDGRLLRYQIDLSGQVTDLLDITPSGVFSDADFLSRRLDCGLGGIGIDAQHPGRVILSSICHPDDDTVYLSDDFGHSFTPILHGLEIGTMHWTVPYMRPQFNGGKSIVHWICDIQIDPFYPDRALFVTGTGIFGTSNLANAARGKSVDWMPLCDGLEETVHLNVYSLPRGEVRLLDIVGDLGGFAFKQLDSPCENSFDDAQQNRYITCMNADFPDNTATPVVITARGNWKGKTIGGLILSEDDCHTWIRLNDPVSIHPLADILLARIRTPNVNAGWAAISADGKVIIWGLADGNTLPVPALARTPDRGISWQACEVYDRQGSIISDAASCIKVMSDRVWPDVFYGFGEQSQLYVSTDKGHTFHELATPPQFPLLNLAGIDSEQHYEIRLQSGVGGIVWLALGTNGLWRLTLNTTLKAFLAEQMSANGDAVYRVGLGKSTPGSQKPTLFCNATLQGIYGFYRSIDEGRTFDRINTDQQMFGDIRSIAGDPRNFGRFYIGTGTCGVLYANPVA